PSPARARSTRTTGRLPPRRPDRTPGLPASCPTTRGEPHVRLAPRRVPSPVGGRAEDVAVDSARAPMAQLAEAAGLNPACSGFESRWGHHERVPRYESPVGPSGSAGGVAAWPRTTTV